MERCHHVEVAQLRTDGSLVAAPTAGMPEEIGGERNWDYRYTCVQGASFSVHTLVRMGFVMRAPASVGLGVGQPGWHAIGLLLDWLADNWDQPEEGIWVSRGGHKNFTSGRLMCWVAFDCGIRLATPHGRSAPLALDS